MNYSDIPWETILLVVFGTFTYAWSQLKGNGALAAKGWKWQILTYIIDGVIQMTYRTYIKKYGELTEEKVSPSVQRIAMNVAVKETKERAQEYGITLPLLQDSPKAEAQLIQLIESRIAVAKSAKSKGQKAQKPKDIA